MQHVPESVIQAPESPDAPEALPGCRSISDDDLCAWCTRLLYRPCVESFFHSLKVECIHGEHFISREIMRATVFNYIECDYNRWRRHSWCGGLSPEQFENKNLA